jgi:hypothetical protein
MYKRNFLNKNNEPLFKDREKTLKTLKKISCELTLIDFTWMEDREIYKTHRAFDQENPKLANNYSTAQIKNGLKKLVELGYISQKLQ